MQISHCLLCSTESFIFFSRTLEVVEYMSILTKHNEDIEIEIYTFLLLSQPMCCLSPECPQYGPDRHMDASRPRHLLSSQLLQTVFPTGHFLILEIRV